MNQMKRKCKVFAYLTPEEYQKMLHMAVDDSLNDSRFIAKLITAEWARRYSRPNPAVRVSDAMTAGRALETVVSAHESSVAEPQE